MVTVFFPFVGRLVENKALKKAFSDFYGTILLRHTHPFVYLKLGVDPHDIDVNVHPTKSEVKIQDGDFKGPSIK